MERLESEPLFASSGQRDQYEYGAIGGLEDSSPSSFLSYEEGGEEEFREHAPDPTTVLQAAVFIEDAFHYRAINHRVDEVTLRWYRKYYSPASQWFLYGVIVVLHLLAFVERPSSLSITADLRKGGERIELPCGVTETIEILCLLVLLADLCAKVHFKGWQKFFVRNRWLLAYMFVITASVVDWLVSVGMLCQYTYRFRRMLRPFFLLQNSSLMKKTVNSLRRTLSELFSVLLLLFIHLYFFTLFGMLLFPKESHHKPQNGTQTSEDDEYGEYFSNLLDSFMNLLVLLTTANNPDITMPAYNLNRFYALFFIAFLVIGLYCLMSMLTAVIYNQFRGYFLNSMQASLFRRRLGVRAAYEVLSRRRHMFKHHSSLDTGSTGVSSQHVRIVVKECHLPEQQKEFLYGELDLLHGCAFSYAQFQEVFCRLEEEASRRQNQRYEMREVQGAVRKVLQRIIASKYFIWFGCFVAVANVICISVELAVEYEHVRQSSNTYLGTVNLVLIPYYFLEQLARIWAFGFRKYYSDWGNMFDALIVVVLTIVEGIYLVMYGIPFWGQDVVDEKSIKLWDLVRIINMLIMVKLLRMITTQYKAMFVVMSTITDLIKNLKAFAGLLVIAYYSYAILGIMLFQNKIAYMDILNDTLKNNGTFVCGSYEQLQYWSNNFDDFAAALVVLWDVMVVNNWHVFLHAYSRAVSKWAQLYFVVWWLIASVIALNLFTALILENFIMRWDRISRATSARRATLDGGSLTASVDADRVSFVDSFHTEYLTVHDMFRGDLQEPSEESLLVELQQHPFLNLDS